MVMQTVAEMVTAAKGRIENLSPDEVEQEVRTGVLLVDIRESAERQDGVIAGSIHAPRGMLEFHADPTSPYHLPEFDPERRVVLYCASGGRSALAADMLRQLGYDNVAHLDGGIKGWVAAGKPLVQPS